WVPYAVPATLSDLGLLQMSHSTPAQIRACIDAAVQSTAPKDLAGKKILAFAMLPHWIDYMTAAASILAARGAEVELVWLPYGYNFTSADPRSYTRWVRWRYAHVFRDDTPGFRGRELKIEPSDASLESPFIDRMAMADTQYALRIEEVNLDDAEHRAVYTFRRRRLAEAYAALQREVKRVEPDVLFTANGQVLEYTIAWQLAHDMGITPTTLESWERRNTAVAAAGRRCVQIDSETFWKKDEPHILTDERRARVQHRIEERQGTAWTGYAFKCQYADAVNPSELYDQLGLDRERPIVLACANVPWDAMYANRLGLFDTMSEWVRALLRHFENRTEYQLIIRAHPGEVSLGTRQTCEETIRALMPTLPPHIRFIAPDANVNTYSLMQLTRLGLVFNSTAGLEMAMRGIPVIMPVKAHYANKGFTIDPKTPEEYFQAIERQLQPDAPMMSEEQIRMAWCYFDLYVHEWPLQFPWNLGSLREDLAEWPVERVLGEEGRARFGSTFDIIANEGQSLQ
ncbi:MAG TPA: hypothetical protein VEU30_15125, partial [Thermoanaerobaculia bacterium]|nr:hypothetical protein [Thermoanaerobaculia bacterium]